MIGVVMAGGRATRFSGRVEKGLLEVRGITLLERSIRALRDGGMDEIVVAATSWTERTEALARGLGTEVIVTPGEGYHDDVLKLLENYGSFVSLNVDVPFANGGHVKAIADESSRGSVAAVVPFAMAIREPDEDSALLDARGAKMLWVGLNHVTSEPLNHLRVLEDPLLTVNINTESDLEFARDLAEKRKL